MYKEWERGGLATQLLKAKAKGVGEGGHITHLLRGATMYLCRH